MVNVISRKLKTLCLALVFIYSLTLIINPMPVSGALLDTNDQANVRTPTPNSVVRGVAEIKFRVFDNNRSYVPSRIEILDASCTNKQRTIINANLPSTKQDQVRGWNSAAGYADGGALADGSYCFSLCTNLMNGASPYSVCQRRRIVLRNRPNNAPRITSTPRTSVVVGSNYIYNITASDIDGDRLSYRVVQKPSFLTFSGNRLSGNNLSKAGSYKVVLEVTDGFGGLARQTYTLKVSAPTKPTQPNEPKPTDPNKPEPKPIALEFIYPLGDSILSGKDNLVEWKLENVQDKKPQKLLLEYRKVSSPDWTVLKELGAAELLITKSFNWDVSSLTNEKYRLRLNLTVKGDNVEATSSEFEVRNEGTTPEPQPEAITITNLVPENGAALSELKDKKVSAQISIDGDKVKTLTAAQVKVKINDVEQNNCQLNKNDDKNYKIECTLADASVGEYDVIIEVAEYSAKREWSFSIVNKDKDSEPINIQDYLPVGIALGVILCLLLLPLLLLAIVRRRRSMYSTTVVERNVDDGVVTNYDNLTIGDPFESPSRPVSPAAAALPVAAATAAVATTAATSTPEAKSSDSGPTVGSRIKNGWQGFTNKVRQTVKERLPKPKEKETVTTVSQPTPVPVNNKSAITPKSTAEILEGNFSLNDSFAGDNPVAPVAKSPAVSNASSSAQVASTTPLAPAAPAPQQPVAKSVDDTAKAAPAVVSAATSPAVTPAASAPAAAPKANDDDLPDWLKSDTNTAATLPGKDDALEQKQQSNSKAKQDDDDGSDPYGFGEYSLGDPN